MRQGGRGGGERLCVSGSDQVPCDRSARAGYYYRAAVSTRLPCPPLAWLRRAEVFAFGFASEATCGFAFRVVTATDEAGLAVVVTFVAGFGDAIASFAGRADCTLREADRVGAAAREREEGVRAATDVG